MNKKLLSKRFAKDYSGNIKEGLLPSQLLHVNKINQHIATGIYKLEDYACVCGSTGGWVISEVERYGLLLQSILCDHCGTIRFSPFLNNESITHFYTNSYQEMYRRSVDENKYFDIQKQYGNKFLAIATPYINAGDYVVELGCGAGGALSVFRDAGFNVAGHDFDQRLIEKAHREGLYDIVYGDLEELVKKLPTVKPTLIFSNHVFEHVHNPEQVLNTCMNWLADDGMLIHAVPDIYKIKKGDSYQGDILGMLHISHVYNYTLEGLSALAEKVGMEVKELKNISSMITPTSNMGELWIMMKKKKSDSPAIHTAKDHSRNKLSVLERHEREFLKPATKRTLLQRIKSRIKRYLK